MEAETSPVFLIGMPRSGTSLIRAVLHRHPSIGIPVRGELQYFRDWHGRWGELSEAAARDKFAERFFRESKFSQLGIDAAAVMERFGAGAPTYRRFFCSVMEEYAHVHGARRWGEKSTTHIEHLPTLLREFPEARLVLIVRDPRDTFLSLRNVGWNRGRPVDPYLFAKRWKSLYASALAELLGHSERLFVHRHEQFIADPEDCGSRLLQFLGETWDREYLNIERLDWSQNSSFGSSSGRASNNSVGRWKEGLARYEAKQIQRVCGDLMEAFGYEAHLPWFRDRPLVRTLPSTLKHVGIRARERLARRVGRGVSESRP